MSDRLEELKDIITRFEAGLDSLRDLMKYIKAVDDGGINTGNSLQTLQLQRDNAMATLGQLLEPLNPKISDLALKVTSFEQLVRKTADEVLDSSTDESEEDKKDRKLKRSSNFS